MPKLSSRVKADLALFLVTIFWGSSFAVLRLALENKVVFYLNGLRLLFGALLILLLAWRRGEALKREHLPSILVTGGVLSLAVIFQMTGLSTTTAGNAGFITSLYVVFVPFFLWVLWREKPTISLALAVLLAVFGGYLLSTGGAFRLVMGDVWVGVSAIFWAMHVVAIGYYAKRVPPFWYAAGQFLVAGLVNLLVGAWLESPSPQAMLAILPSVFYTGFFSIAVGFTMQILAQRHTPPGDTALILSLEAIFAALFGWILVGEILLPVQALGAALIFIAVILAQAKEFHTRLSQPPAESSPN